MALHSDEVDASRHEAKGIDAGVNNSVCMKNSAGVQEFVPVSTALGGGLVTYNSTPVSTGANTTETTLFTHTITGGTLTSVGEGVKCFASGITASNGNVKKIDIKAGGTGTLTLEISDSGALWTVEIEVYYLTTTTADVRAYLHSSTAGGGGNKSEIHNSQMSITWASNFDIIITGQNGTATATDITGNFSRSSIIT